MCPPSSEDSLLARSTIATAFHRISDRIRCSMARSPGCGGCWPGGIVFRYGVFAEYGTGAPLRRASLISSSSRNPARSAPSNSSTESNASRHSLVSTGSSVSHTHRSFVACLWPSPGQSAVRRGRLADGRGWSVRPAAGITCCRTWPAAPADRPVAGPPVAVGSRMAGESRARPASGGAGSSSSIMVGLVERVLPAEHTAWTGPRRTRRPTCRSARWRPRCRRSWSPRGPRT